MNKRLIIVITIAASIAIIVLIGVQFYWVEGAIKLRESIFKRNVSEAVYDALNKLERSELSKIIIKRDDFNELLNSIDSINNLIYIETGQVDSVINDINYLKNNINKNDIDKNNNTTTNALLRQKHLNKKRAALYEQIFNELLTSPFVPNIEHRVNSQLLDSLLKESFAAKQINTEYLFGIYDNQRKLMVIESDPVKREILLKKGIFFPMSTQYFTADYEYLIIYFPKQTKYLLKQLNDVVIVSGVLMLVIILAFAIVVIAILKQKKVSQLKNDFINNMTHEFKTPISTVALACEVLKDKSVIKSNEIIDTYIDIIDQENKRLGTLAEKILQTAIIEKGQLYLKLENIDVHEIILDIIKKIGIQVEIRDGSITPFLNAKKHVIKADKVHIINIINNLLDNANKYSNKKPIISITTENQQDGIIISIKDNGIGISKANQKKIFENLYRVPTGNVHNVKGFGLGLSYVKFAVEKHKGNVMVDSDIGKGAVFSIFLPFNL